MWSERMQAEAESDRVLFVSLFCGLADATSTRNVSVMWMVVSGEPKIGSVFLCVVVKMKGLHRRYYHTSVFYFEII